MSQTNEWRETVRDLYDDLHFGQDSMFTGSRLAKRLIAFIEDRHPGFFNEPREPVAPHYLSFPPRSEP